MNRFIFNRLSIVATCTTLLFPHTALADINVLASIKPLHSLVSMVMGDAGQPKLIVSGAASPHGYALTPSQAQDMEQADVIFWISDELEAFLEKPLETIGKQAHSVEMMDIEGLTKFPFRKNIGFDTHSHDDHTEHEGHDKHNHDGHNDHDHQDKKHDDHDDHNKHNHDGHDDHKDHGTHDGHAHGPDDYDPHIWLSPKNAQLMVQHIANILSQRDPDNTATYAQNSRRALMQIDRLAQQINSELAEYKQHQFIVFHDAYQYFEREFTLQAAGAISLNPEVAPGARRISEIQNIISQPRIKCVFTEPQFTPKVVKIVLEGTSKKPVEIDPLGASLEPGADLYLQMIKTMKDAFISCLR